MALAQFKHNIHKPGQTYNFKGRYLWFGPDDLCPDCTTPAVWIEGEELEQPYVAYQYHDATCPDARAYGANDWRWPIWNSKGPNKTPDELFAEWKRQR